MAKYQFSIPEEVKKKFSEKVEKKEGCKKKDSKVLASLMRRYNNGELD